MHLFELYGSPQDVLFFVHFSTMCKFENLEEESVFREKLSRFKFLNIINLYYLGEKCIQLAVYFLGLYIL